MTELRCVFPMPIYIYILEIRNFIFSFLAFFWPVVYMYFIIISTLMCLCYFQAQQAHTIYRQDLEKDIDLIN